MSEFTITVDTHPFDDDLKLYQKKEFTLYPGINSLVGCNGSGKSTLIDCYLVEKLKKEHIGYYQHNDRHDGQQNYMSKLGFHEAYEELAQMFMASEGERIVQALAPVFSQLRPLFREHKGGSVFIIFDAIDSGMSVDEIIEIRGLFLDLVIPDAKSTFDVDVYMVIAANNYEWCNDSRIHNIDITTAKEITFSSYEDYVKHIKNSRKKKDKMRGVTDE